MKITSSREVYQCSLFRVTEDKASDKSAEKSAEKPAEKPDTNARGADKSASRAREAAPGWAATCAS